jgi:hypothetical protein
MIVYYITAHGYGHGVRSCEVINAIFRADPSVTLGIVSDLPPGFIRNRLTREPDFIRAGSFDVGMVQLDSVRVDVDASLEKVQRLVANRAGLIESEKAFLASSGARVVVADIPAIPIEAAAQLGLPVIAVGNFGWNWIYEDFADADSRWLEISEAFAEGYGAATELMRLPFSEPMSVFPRPEDFPLMSLPGEPDREALAQRTGADPGKRWVLMSWSTLEWSEEALDTASALTDWELFTIAPLGWDRPNMHMIDRDTFGIPETFATVDIVLSKPGYGVLSECVVNQKPLIYVERENFREYPIMEAAIHQHLQYQHLPAADLYAGQLREALEGVENAPPPREKLSGDGGDRAAARILSYR